jgi:hypothetical protein
MLRFPEGEAIEWYRNNTSEHRSLDFCIALTSRALYIFSSFWLIFSRWRRIPLREIRDASFLDSRYFPALHIQLINRIAKLRSPPSSANEMQYDRRSLTEAADRVRAIAQSESHDA